MQNPTELLKQRLQRAMTLVSQLWSYKTKDWVTGIHVVDIDSEGDQEIIVGSRDGRVRMLSEQGEKIWERIVGSKMPISAVMGVVCKPDESNSLAILVGTQNGRVYALNEKGETLSKDRQEIFAFDELGRAIDSERDAQASWYESEYEIRRFAADLSIAPQVVIDTEQRNIQAFDSTNGRTSSIFQLPTHVHGRVSAVFAGDLNSDGMIETLVATTDQHLYLLNDSGEIIAEFEVPGQIHLIGSAQLERDGSLRVLLGMDEKVLIQIIFASSTHIEWRHPFPSEFHSLCIADIDGDNEREILVGSEDRHLYILDSAGKERWRHFAKQHITSLYAADVDGDGKVEVLVGAEENKENSLRALHIDLEAGMLDEIRSIYQDLGRPGIAGIAGLAEQERALLQDLVVEARPTARPPTLEQIEKLMATKQYLRALTGTLQLEQEHMQFRWQTEHLGLIKDLCFGDVYSDPRREIIAGTVRGAVHVFNASGIEVGAFTPGGQILGVCTAYLVTNKYAAMLVGSTDNTVYVLNPTRQPKGAGRTSLRGQITRSIHLEDQLVDICVNTDEKNRSVEVVLATEEKHIHVYGRALDEPGLIFSTPEVISVLAARVPDNEKELAIVAGGVKDSVYAFARNGALLWEHPVYGRVEALCIEDIDSDGFVEVIAGSQGRNLYVIDINGQLKWRYYLPDYVFSVDVVDIDHDGRLEVLAGCKDAYLYVFNREGDLLWKYQAREPISFLGARDINDDRSVEVVMALGDTLSVMQVVDSRNLRSILNQCWHELQKQHPKTDIQKFLHHQSALLRAFALRKLAEQPEISEEDFKECAALIKDGAVEVRKALISTTLQHYHAHTEAAQLMLLQLGRDQDIDVMTTLVREITRFIKLNSTRNWDIGFKHLQRITNRYVMRVPKDGDRYILHSVMRALFYLTDDFYQLPQRKRAIFDMLLPGLLYEKSQWVQYEAARTLAQFLDLYHANLLVYLEILIVKKVRPEILRRVVYHVRTYSIKHVLNDLSHLIDSLNERNVLTHLDIAIKSLAEIRSLRFGEEAWLLYKELQRLMSMRSVVDLAAYQCSLDENSHTTNQHYLSSLTIFSRLYLITRPLQRYLARVGIKDRVSSLLEASRAIDKTIQFVHQEYSTLSFEEPRTNLPDYHIFLFIFKRWNEIVDAELQRVSGKPEISASLETKLARSEERIAVSLQLHNSGQSTAYCVHIELLASEQFDVMGSNTYETDALFAQGTVSGEFTISPLAPVVDLPLAFEIEYQETEDGALKTQRFDEQLRLRAQEQREFQAIPNPYSSGLPMKNMCYGREEDLKELSAKLLRTRTRSLLILFGQRRTGKTTVLLQLTYADILDPHIPCLIDVQRIALGISESRFFTSMAYSIMKALKERDIHMVLPDDAAFEHNPTFTFDRLLDEVEASLGERKLIILIDEFDVLDELVKSEKLAPEIFGYLRSLMQHRDKISFLLAGVHTINELTQKYWSVFFQIADHHRLTHLSEKATIELITQPVKDYLEYDDIAIKKIRQLTADQPYLVHMICRRLVEYCNDRHKHYVTANDINAIRDEIMLYELQHFEWLWEESSEEEHILLAIIAEAGGADGRSLSLIEIEEQYRLNHIRYARENILATLKGMVAKDILEKTPGKARENGAGEDRYRVSVGLIRGWLRNTRPVSQLVREQGPRV